MVQPERHSTTHTAKKNRRRRRKPLSAKRPDTHDPQVLRPIALAAKIVPDSTADNAAGDDNFPAPTNGFVVSTIKPSSMPHTNSLVKPSQFTGHNNQTRRKKPSHTSRTHDLRQFDSNVEPKNKTGTSTSKSTKVRIQNKPHNRSTKYNRNPRKYQITQTEISAGGLIVRGFAADHLDFEVALIGRIDRRGRLLWSIPKGHIEKGETAETAAKREILEETGLKGNIIGKLGSIQYSFVVECRKVHKTVHHFLLAYDSGDISTEDAEVNEVQWIKFEELGGKLTYSDEKKLQEKARILLEKIDPAPHSVELLIKKFERLEPNDYEIEAAEKNLLRNIPISSIPAQKPVRRRNHKYRSKERKHSNPSTQQPGNNVKS